MKLGETSRNKRIKAADVLAGPVQEPPLMERIGLTEVPKRELLGLLDTVSTDQVVKRAELASYLLTLFPEERDEILEKVSTDELFHLATESADFIERLNALSYLRQFDPVKFSSIRLSNDDRENLIRTRFIDQDGTSFATVPSLSVQRSLPRVARLHEVLGKPAAELMTTELEEVIRGLEESSKRTNVLEHIRLGYWLTRLEPADRERFHEYAQRLEKKLKVLLQTIKFKNPEDKIFYWTAFKTLLAPEVEVPGTGEVQIVKKDKLSSQRSLPDRLVA